MAVSFPRPEHGKVRVVLEKPFGRDFDEVSTMVQGIYETFEPTDVFLMDHYLGKRGVAQILPFTFHNRHFMRHDIAGQVKEVKVNMFETEDCR
jgi:glucose-6-phosphate 1-dehydrogenase